MTEQNLHTFNVAISAWECFVVAAEANGSWSAAATEFASRNVKLNRWAIKRQVEALEAYLEVNLFDRTENATELNSAGEHYLREATLLLEQAAVARHRVQLISPPKWKTFGLGYTPSPTVEFREPAVHAFATKHRSVPVVPNELSGDGCKSEVAAGRLLLALMPEPIHMPPGMEFLPLIEYPICCIVSGNDVRFTNAKAVNVKELQNDLWLPLNRKEFRQHNEYVRNILSPHFAPLFSTNEYDGHESILSAVYQGQGVALFLSTMATLSAHLRVNVKVLPFDPPLAIVKVGAIYRTPSLEIVKRFMDSAVAAVKSLPRTNKLTALQGRVLC